MAWSAPRTYVDGEVITASILNIDHRDNLLALSLHRHSGAAGDGDDVLQFIDSIGFNTASPVPSAPGSGKLVLYHDGTNMAMKKDASETVIALSDENHSHTPTLQDDDSDIQKGTSPWTTNDIFRTGAIDRVEDVSINLSKTGLIVVSWCGIISADRDWEMRINAAVKDSATNAQEFSGIYAEEYSSGSHDVEVECTDYDSTDDSYIYVSAMALEV